MCDKLLDILCCPIDHSSLSPAKAELIHQINETIRAGKLHNRAGRRLKKTIDSGFIREKGDLLYPVVDQIPVLLQDEAIPLSQFQKDAG